MTNYNLKITETALSHLTPVEEDKTEYAKMQKLEDALADAYNAWLKFDNLWRPSHGSVPGITHKIIRKITAQMVKFETQILKAQRRAGPGEKP